MVPTQQFANYIMYVAILYAILRHNWQATFMSLHQVACMMTLGVSYLRLSTWNKDINPNIAQHVVQYWTCDLWMQWAQNEDGKLELFNFFCFFSFDTRSMPLGMVSRAPRVKTRGWYDVFRKSARKGYPVQSCPIQFPRTHLPKTSLVSLSFQGSRQGGTGMQEVPFGFLGLWSWIVLIQSHQIRRIKLWVVCYHPFMQYLDWSIQIS